MIEVPVVVDCGSKGVVCNEPPDNFFSRFCDLGVGNSFCFLGVYDDSVQSAGLVPSHHWFGLLFWHHRRLLDAQDSILGTTSKR